MDRLYFLMIMRYIVHPMFFPFKKQLSIFKKSNGKNFEHRASI
jgi:hypothetical protein